MLQMARILTPELAAFYMAYYEAKGIKLLKGHLPGCCTGIYHAVSAAASPAADGAYSHA